MYTIIAYLIFNLMLTLSYERFMRVFFNERQTSVLITVGSYILYYVLSSLVFFFVNIPIVNLLIYFILFYVITFNYESSFKKRLIAVVCSLLCMLTVYLLVIFVLHNYRFSLFEAGIALDFGAYIFLVSGFLTYSIAVLFRKFRNIKKNTRLSPLFFTSFSVIQIASLTMMFLVLDPLPQSLMFVVVFLIFSVNVFIFYLYDKLSETHEKELKAKINEKEKMYYFSQCQVMQESVDTVKSIRHDMSVHLAVLRGFTEDNQLIINYIDRLIGDIAQSKSYSNTGNIVFDSVINFKLKNLKENNINANVKTFIPCAINIDAVDAVIILSNLLDNALTAVKNVENKIINLNISFSKNCLFIKIQNTFDGVVKYKKQEKSEEMVITTRKDGGQCGYGLSNIKNSIEKYNGEMSITHDDNVFSVGILMYVQN